MHADSGLSTLRQLLESIGENDRLFQLAPAKDYQRPNVSRLTIRRVHLAFSATHSQSLPPIQRIANCRHHRIRFFQRNGVAAIDPNLFSARIKPDKVTAFRIRIVGQG